MASGIVQVTLIQTGLCVESGIWETKNDSDVKLSSGIESVRTESGIAAADRSATVTLTTQSAISLAGRASDWPALYMSTDVSSTKIGLGVPTSPLKAFMSGIWEFAAAGTLVEITKGCSAAYIPKEGPSMVTRPDPSTELADEPGEVVDLGKVTKYARLCIPLGTKAGPCVFVQQRFKTFNQKIIPNPTQNHKLLCVSTDTRMGIRTNEGK